MTKKEIVRKIEILIIVYESAIKDFKNYTDDYSKGVVIAYEYSLEELKALLK